MSSYLFWYVYLVGSSAAFLLLVLGNFVGLLLYCIVLFISLKASTFIKWRKEIASFKSVEIKNVVICLSPLSLFIIGRDFEELLVLLWFVFFSLNNFSIDKAIKRSE